MKKVFAKQINQLQHNKSAMELLPTLLRGVHCFASLSHFSIHHPGIYLLTWCQTTEWLSEHCVREGEEAMSGDSVKHSVTHFENWCHTAVLSIPPLIPAGIYRIWLESRNSCGMDRILDGFLSIPCTFKRKTTLHKTDQSYTKEITIKGISSYVQNYHIRKKWS